MKAYRARANETGPKAHIVWVTGAALITCVWAGAHAQASSQTAPEQSGAPGAATQLPEVTVSGTREEELLVETPASIGVIRGDVVDEVKPTHPSQIVGQVPGAAVTVTNGEGHTTAIRQPFTTDPVYLFLEDGIPTRSTGFFNHNALYETNLPMAGGIEVTRGPGSVLYGSDAIGGIVNVLTRRPPRGEASELMLSGEGGSHGWWRLLGGGGLGYASGGWRGDFNVTHTDGWRDKTGYNRHGGNLRWDHETASAGSFKTLIGYSKIDQDTGANAPLPRALYKHHPTTNLHSIAFRKVEAFRISTTYEYERGNDLISLIPYFRDNSMDLLASFRLAAPDPTVYTTENQSFGLLAKWRRDFPGKLAARLIAGVDIDYSPGSRDESRIFVNFTGAGASRNFTSYTTGPKLYDYDVSFTGISPYVHGEISPVERLRISGGVRYDRLEYDFDNKLAPGLLEVAGRFYGQPDDDKVRFTRFTPKIGATYEFAPNLHGFVSYNRGFRAPSENQLFRPAGAATPAQAQALLASALDLKPIKAEQYEIGLRGNWNALSYNVALYRLEKDDDILSFTDTATNETQTVNAGRTLHRGIEIGLGLPLLPGLRADVAFSYAKHTYKDWVVATGATPIDFSGNEIESAPRVLANTRLTWAPVEPLQLQLEWVRVGSYYMDAANTAKYSGHNLLNLRARWSVTRDVTLYLNINNLGDKRYADSASISSNTPVFAPGLPRTYYAGVELKW